MIPHAKSSTLQIFGTKYTKETEPEMGNFPMTWFHFQNPRDFSEGRSNQAATNKRLGQKKKTNILLNCTHLALQKVTTDVFELNIVENPNPERSQLRRYLFLAFTVW